MTSDNSNNPNTNDMNYRSHRRGSVTSAAFTNLFRSNSTSQGTGFPGPGPITSAAMNEQRRRLSISTLGLSGASPTSSNSTPFARRASLSTNNSDSIDENAIEEEDTRTAPATPFTRRMSFGAQAAMRNMRAGGGSPGNNDQGFNWSEQLRSRAESTVAGSRPNFSYGMSASAPRPVPGGGGAAGNPYHDRSKSVPDMPAPPAQAPRPRQPQKPDHFQERILKGDFYMD